MNVQIMFNDQLMGTATTVNYEIQRTAAPIYVFGNADPRAFTRGNREIKGTIDLLPEAAKHIRENVNNTVDIHFKGERDGKIVLCKIKQADLLTMDSDYQSTFTARHIDLTEFEPNNESAAAVLLKRL